jgi:aspartate/methionine/tyrosine aminotransferase
VPVHPKFSAPIARMRGSVYSKLAHRLAERSGEVYPFHVGDTWLQPAPGCRMEDLRVQEFPRLHNYAPVQGRPGLVEAIAERATERTGEAVDAAQVLVTAGATGGLGAVLGAIVEPGDEVVVLAPHWPLIAGIVRALHGVAVQVPFFGAVHDAAAGVAAVESVRNARTVALYLNTPNNPTGRVLPRDWLLALVHWAREHDLWVIADEVYDDYVFEGEHSYTRPMAPERTFAAYSFSKGYGMAGNRLGYVIGPAAAMAQVRKVSTHTFYSAPTASQVAAERVLRGPGPAWADDARAAYAAVGRESARRLGLPAPQGSTFLFVDVSDALDARGLEGLLSDCVDRGVLAAPGPAFGPYPTHIRVCFTATPPEQTLRGIDILADILTRGAGRR